MGRYSLDFRKSAVKELEALPKRDLQRMLERIEALSDDPRPHGAEKLTNDDKYRFRQGDYRVLYEIDERHKRVTVVRIAHSREVYR